MNRRVSWRFVFAKLAAAAMLYLGAAPAYLLAGAALMPSRMGTAALLPLAAVMLTYGAGYVRGRWRRPLFAVAVVLAAGLHALLFLPGRPLLLLYALPSLLLMFALMPAMSRPPYREWTVAQAGLGIGVGVAGLAFSHCNVFTGSGTLLSWFFSGYLLLL